MMNFTISGLALVVVVTVGAIRQFCVTNTVHIPAASLLAEVRLTALSVTLTQLTTCYASDATSGLKTDVENDVLFTRGQVRIEASIYSEASNVEY